jgi:hypothetical protein
MKEPKNVRIIVVPVGQMEREDLENIEYSCFTSKAQVVNYLFSIRRGYMKEENVELHPHILTASEFRTQLAFQPAVYKAFNVAMSNVRKRKQCYNLSEFVDEFNNQEFGGETDKYWIGYVKFRKYKVGM